MKNHITLMFIYAVLTASFFALLWRERNEERVRLFLVIFSALFFGGIVAGWVMYPLPLNR